MRKSVLSLALLAITCSLLSMPAQAQPARVFVAAQGSDSNPCSFALPCRTFQHAHDVLGVNGEIDVLDPAGYGALTINKAISIQGHGFSGVSTSSGTAITINTPSGHVVNLRGLLLDGVGGGFRGIFFSGAGTLDIQDCLFRNFTNGIVFTPNNASELFLSDTHISANSNFGVFVDPSGLFVMSAVFSRVVVVKSGIDGIQINGSASTGTIYAEISDSTIANSNGVGINVGTTTAFPVIVTVRNSMVVNNNDTGLRATGSGAFLRVGRSTVSGNLNGWINSGGTLQSYGDNNINGNSNNETAPPLVALK